MQPGAGTYLFLGNGPKLTGGDTSAAFGALHGVDGQSGLFLAGGGIVRSGNGIHRALLGTHTAANALVPINDIAHQILVRLRWID